MSTGQEEVEELKRLNKELEVKLAVAAEVARKFQARSQTLEAEKKTVELKLHTAQAQVRKAEVLSQLAELEKKVRPFHFLNHPLRTPVSLSLPFWILLTDKTGS